MKATQTGETAVLEAALDKLAASPQAMTNTARVRKMLPKIEAALNAGSTLSEVHNTLLENGWDITAGAFRGALDRARKRPGKGGPRGTRQARGTPPPPALDIAPTNQTEQAPDAARRSKKQQRELAADQWIKSPQNPIIDRFIDKESKS